MKTVLITDGGGRGAALVDKYGQSKYVGRILVVPGNDLMQINTKRKVITYPYLKTTSVSEIVEIAKVEKVDLVDAAQENAIEAGLVDELNKNDIAVVGPKRADGRLEWDKAWAREFMGRFNIPHPKYKVFNSQKEGVNFVYKQKNESWFVKASGLAEGKGAIPARNKDEAIAAIVTMSKFGSSGKTFLLEEWLEGEEFSAFALSDGNTFKMVGFAQDHKRVNNFDKGPNTGGMGCVSNPLIINTNIKNQIADIFQKTIQGLKKEEHPYKGVLYLGGMVVKGKVYVIEFNVRWGDPEAEAIIPSVKNDLYEVGKAIISGNIKKIKIQTDKKIRVVVAACAKGYPDDYSKVKGKKILGIDEVVKTGVKVYGAGVKKVNGQYVVNGGRVLYVMAEGKDVVEARQKVYSAMKLISIEGDNLHYRTDIGWRDLERMQHPERSRRIERLGK